MEPATFKPQSPSGDELDKGCSFREKLKKPLKFHLAFLSILLMVFIVSLDATALAIAIPTLGYLGKHNKWPSNVAVPVVSVWQAVLVMRQVLEARQTTRDNERAAVSHWRGSRTATA
ncbi:hypothetical protein MY11210_009721 [Beauveria gryllotalpidicola]